MPQNQRKRQQSLERKKAKRQQKKQALQTYSSFNTGTLNIQIAANWLVRECLIAKNWQNPMEISQLLIARESPAGKVGAANFLVDLGSLGVKNAMSQIFPSWGDYREQLRDSVRQSQPMVEIDFNLAAKIIQYSIAYARQLGFSPARDYQAASVLLNGADPEADPTPIPLGRDGKPFYFAGPYDNTKKILATLEKNVGAGNFDYFVFAGPPDFSDEDDELMYVDEDDE